MTNTGTTTAPRTPFWRGKKPNIGDLGALLNHVTEAALILDRVSFSVLFVNSAFLNLTAFVADDLSLRQLVELIPDTLVHPMEINEERQARLVREKPPTD